MDDVAEFVQQRPRLFAIAYRMLGEASEAEDVLQDAYLRWSGRATVETPAAWLTTVVTNLCINRLTSARARRERYVGPWLPEPVATGNDPEGAVELKDTVSLGFLVLLEKLTPPERAVFVLREAFGYTHRDSAEVLGVDEAHARQLYHRALARIGDARRRFEARPADGTKLVESFIAATVDGDVQGLEAILTEDAAIWADGGGKAIAAREPIFGRGNAAHYLAGLAAGPRALTARLSVVEVNDAPAVLVHEAGELTAVLVPEIHGTTITTIRAILNPDKLAYLRSQLG
ncbi:RNA polymerase sigma-70 factor [Kribbella jejuensis]|uniref:RNA polymerase sigma-70 factor (ECF subfamily) n=1 Tax=Kribbella jejuensis TaxID=236068 RepID=A0A542EAW4_9ACTN|nr:RNA polymerase sigma factor SigJ [Kribbella jejuensis]TQJ12461.1 RNA polymerase sigma-70 factor (ECF subfamily) [Kribbella jejuensis]